MNGPLFKTWKKVSLDFLFKVWASLWWNSLAEGVELEDAGQEDGESDHGAAHGVDDDSFGDELGVLVTDRLDGHHRLARQGAGQFTTGTEIEKLK